MSIDVALVASRRPAMRFSHAALAFVLAAVFAVRPCGAQETVSDAGGTPARVQLDDVTVEARTSPRLHLAITRSNGEARTPEVADVVESIREIRLSGDRFVALGRLRGSAGDVTLVGDTRRGEILATLWGFQPVISPDAKHVVYEKFIPRMMTSDPWPAVLLADVNAPEVVGREVYPGSAAGGAAHSVISPFLWSEDGRRVVFFDKIGQWASWDDYRVAFVSLALSDAGATEVRTSPVDPAQWALAGVPKDEIHLYVSRLHWRDPRTIEAQLHEQPYWRQSTVAFRVDDQGSLVEATAAR